MKWSQVLKISRPTSQNLRQFSVLLDIETEFHQAMEQNLIRKPFLPLLTRAFAHYYGFGLALFKKARDLRGIIFANADGEFFPTWTFGGNPGIGEDHGHTAHGHCFKKPDARYAQPSRAKDELAGFRYLGIPTVIIQPLA